MPVAKILLFFILFDSRDSYHHTSNLYFFTTKFILRRFRMSFW